MVWPSPRRPTSTACRSAADVVWRARLMKLMLAEPFKSLWAGPVRQGSRKACRAGIPRAGSTPDTAWKSTATDFRQDPPWHQLGRNLQNLLTAKLPVLGAGQEWSYPAFAGSRRADHDRRRVRRRAATRRISTRSSSLRSSRPSVSNFGIDWIKQPCEPKLKRALIAEVAHDGMMHRAGVNHRDCYICHYLLHR